MIKTDFKNWNSEHCFQLPENNKFLNQKIRLIDSSFYFDGYSTWLYHDRKDWVESKDFSITIVLAPYTFEHLGSGILSSLDRNEKAGFGLSIKKQGRVKVDFGTGDGIYTFDSLTHSLKLQEMQTITLVFWGSAGWCDLYLNGERTNRKQFPRNSSIKWSDQGCFLGKYVDHATFLEHTKQGVFHGLIKSVEIIDRVFSLEEAKSRHQEEELFTLSDTNLCYREDYLQDIHRPSYHMIAPGKWMNEPHAPFYYNGYYHIFYQANPHAPIWDHICWGHAISRDMIHWKDMPIALYPDSEGLDIDGCWSGSGCMDKKGNPIIFYTAGNHNKFPNQGVAIARPQEIEDAELKKWEKGKDLILEQGEKEGFLGEFRDPFVWLEEDTYYILMCSGDEYNHGGNALVYTSSDLQSFTYHGFLLDYDFQQNQEVGHIWELPIMLPLTDEKGVYVCDMLLFCACQIDNDVVETYYFLGNFNRDSKKFEKNHEKAMLFDLGYGSFTGGCGFVTPDQRSVIFTITQGKRNFQEEFESGWAHNAGLPLQLSMNQGELVMHPINEIDFIKEIKILDEKNCTLEQVNKVLMDLDENRYYIRVETTSNNLQISTQCLEDILEISYDREEEMFQCVDPSSGKRISRYRGAIDNVSIGSAPICLEYYLDKSMIEVYVNRKKSITLRNYPKDGGRKIWVNSKDACILSHVTIYKMASING